jgi:hypothetical protein
MKTPSAALARTRTTMTPIVSSRGVSMRMSAPCDAGAGRSVNPPAFAMFVVRRGRRSVAPPVG